MTLRLAIDHAIAREEVPAPVLEAAFDEIMTGAASDAQIAALLVALRTKGETVREIVAAARALRSVALTAPCLEPQTVDTCGTGGDGAGTFNISTTAAFVVAGAGVPVAKHGNRAASSQTGSVDVLEALGVTVDLPVEASAAFVADVGIGAFFARNAHPAMRFVAPVRQALGVRTLMNCMGPLLNPLGVRHQLMGVYDGALVETIASALAELGCQRGLVVHGGDGLDEITTTTTTRAAFVESGTVSFLTIDPQTLGIPLATPAALAGGDAAENATITRAVLDGEIGARRDIVCINAGAALWVAGAAGELAQGVALAVESLDSGRARGKLDALVEASRAWR